jgi:hypothetical protein
MMRECLVTDRARPALAHFEMYQSVWRKEVQETESGDRLAHFEARVINMTSSHELTLTCHERIAADQ